MGGRKKRAHRARKAFKRKIRKATKESVELLRVARERVRRGLAIAVEGLGKTARREDELFLKALKSQEERLRQAERNPYLRWRSPRRRKHGRHKRARR